MQVASGTRTPLAYLPPNSCGLSSCRRNSSRLSLVALRHKRSASYLFSSILTRRFAFLLVSCVAEQKATPHHLFTDHRPRGDSSAQPSSQTASTTIVKDQTKRTKGTVSTHSRLNVNQILSFFLIEFVLNQLPLSKSDRLLKHRGDIIFRR